MCADGWKSEVWFSITQKLETNLSYRKVLDL